MTIKYLILHSLLLCMSLISFTQVNDTLSHKAEEIPLVKNSEVDNPPQFRNETYLGFRSWISDQLNSSMSSGQCPKLNVFVEFIVNSDDSIGEIFLINNGQESVFNPGISPQCKAEIKKLVRSSGEYWKGGTHKGKPVNVMYTFPIKVTYH